MANVVQTKGFICFTGSSIIEQQPKLFVSDGALICFKSFSIIGAKPLLALGSMPNYAVADLKTQTCHLSAGGSSATPLSQLMNNQLFTIIIIERYFWKSETLWKVWANKIITVQYQLFTRIVAPLLKIRKNMKGLRKENHHCKNSTAISWRKELMAELRTRKGVLYLSNKKSNCVYFMML